MAPERASFGLSRCESWPDDHSVIGEHVEPTQLRAMLLGTVWLSPPSRHRRRTEGPRHEHRNASVPSSAAEPVEDNAVCGATSVRHGRHV